MKRVFVIYRSCVIEQLCKHTNKFNIILVWCLYSVISIALSGDVIANSTILTCVSYTYVGRPPPSIGTISCYTTQMLESMVPSRAMKPNYNTIRFNTQSHISVFSLVFRYYSLTAHEK